MMSELAGQGLGILMISSELPEVLGMADRVLVMREGRITAELDRSEASSESVMFAATHARPGGPRMSATTTTVTPTAPVPGVLVPPSGAVGQGPGDRDHPGPGPRRRRDDGQEPHLPVQRRRVP